MRKKIYEHGKPVQIVNDEDDKKPAAKPKKKPADKASDEK